jgi:hypothetical protein
MWPTTLLPLRRKSCYGFLSNLKIHRPRPGLNPRTLGPVDSTLPLDHRGRLYTLEIISDPKNEWPQSQKEVDILIFIFSLPHVSIYAVRTTKRLYFAVKQGVPLNVEPATTACHSSSERTTGKWVSHNAENSRHMLVGGFRVTWDTLYIIAHMKLRFYIPR